jgi:hypothetical protein
VTTQSQVNGGFDHLAIIDYAASKKASELLNLLAQKGTGTLRLGEDTTNSSTCRATNDDSASDG